MFQRIAVAVALLAGAGASATPQAPQTPQRAFTTRTNTVSVFATVQGADGRLVPDLREQDFEILDNGKPVKITLFANTPQPLAVVLLMDMSRSMTGQYAAVIDAAKAFVGAISADDRVRIGSFGREVFVHPLLTSDKARLIHILDTEMWPGGATPLWRAATLGMKSIEAETTRRVILVVTDGNDSGRDYNCAPISSNLRDDIGFCPGQRDVRAQAETDQHMFYVIGLQASGLDAGIKDVADRTGGGHFQIKKGADLKSTFTRVVEELHHQYLIGFEPASFDGRSHDLKVRAVNKDLTVRARKSYVARAEK